MPNRGPLIVDYLARDDRYRGVGSARANALWRRFGDQLYRLLNDGCIQDLAEVVGHEVAAAIVRAWAEDRAAASVVEWLDRSGFDRTLSGKILRVWGAVAPDKIHENPYRMLAFANWPTVDKAATATGIAWDDPRRLVAAVEAVCYDELDRKHTRVGKSTLVAAVGSLLHCDCQTAELSLRLAEQQRAVVRCGESLQALGPSAMERFVAERVLARVRGAELGQMRLLWSRPTREELRRAASEFRTRAGHRLTDEQLAAGVGAVINAFYVILGGAGTGKTSVLECVHYLVERFGGRVIQMALAGRAAKRMQEATGRDAFTIAAFLNGVAKGEHVLDSHTVLAIDEGSLLDLPTTYRLLRAAKGARIVLLGDPAQLPPIGFGLVFHLLAAYPTVARTELTRVHRQEEATGIPSVASAIRNGTLPALGHFEPTEDGVSFIDCDADSALETIAHTLSGMGGHGAAQVLAPTKEGPAGVRTINLALHAVHAARHPRAVRWAPFYVDEPVMYLRNDYRGRDLRNGSLGRIATRQPNAGMAIEFDDGAFVFTAEDLKDLTLAFAIGLHKAQGSQFEACIIPVFPSRLLDRTLIYTAVTRGVRKVVLVGSRAAFRAAVTQAPFDQLRRTGLEEYLRNGDDKDARV